MDQNALVHISMYLWFLKETCKCAPPTHHHLVKGNLQLSGKDGLLFALIKSKVMRSDAKKLCHKLSE